MKQAIILAISLTIIAILSIYTLDQFISEDYSSLEVVVYEDGEEVFSTPFSNNQVVWVFDYNNEELILQDEEISDYFGFDYNMDYENIDNETWDLIYEKTDPGAEINMFKIEDETVTMFEANCKDRICVRSGTISRANQVITCAPHKLVVKIAGVGEFDA